MLFCVTLATERNEIDIDFKIQTGSGDVDYYVGDYFYYNITLLNTGSTNINATFKVEVFNSTGGLMPNSKDFSIYLQPSQTTYLFQNRSSVRTEGERLIYQLETPGTYSISISSETPITYFYYYDDGSYRFDTGAFHYAFDVQPSYQKTQNERWNEFLEKNEKYMNEVEQYIEASKISSDRTKQLSTVSILLALLGTLVSIGNIHFSYAKLAPETQQQYRRHYLAIQAGIVIFMLLLLCAGLVIIGWI